jgi:hypothetical protein
MQRSRRSLSRDGAHPTPSPLPSLWCLGRSVCGVRTAVRLRPCLPPVAPAPLLFCFARITGSHPARTQAQRGGTHRRQEKRAGQRQHHTRKHTERTQHGSASLPPRARGLSGRAWLRPVCQRSVQRLIPRSAGVRHRLQSASGFRWCCEGTVGSAQKGANRRRRREEGST